MKKMIIICAILMSCASISQAASFVWGLGTGRAQFGTGSYITDGTATGTLVFLGMTPESTYSIDNFTVNNTALISKASTSTGFAVTKGRITADFQEFMGYAVGTGTMDNGAVFGMFVTYTDSDNKTWYNVSSSTFTIAGLVDDTTTLDDAVFAFDWTKQAAGTALTSGGGWTTVAPVPEPATGLLALAGVAMLIRRKRA